MILYQLLFDINLLEMILGKSFIKVYIKLMSIRSFKSHIFLVYTSAVMHVFLEFLYFQTGDLLNACNIKILVKVKAELVM